MYITILPLVFGVDFFMFGYVLFAPIVNYFTDAIVLFAIILKPIFSLLLPNHTIFQYLGIWSLICYVLQGVVAAIRFYKTI